MKRIIIMGAAGKDFHVFNTCYRSDPRYQVVAFTATQIPNIDDRRYPPPLAGERYPQGIPIHPEEELLEQLRQHRIDEVVFAYSDVSYEYVEQKRGVVEEAGARFLLPDVQATMVRAQKPVVAICAVRTGCGKSQTTRRVADLLRDKGRTVVVVRHPMPYGDLVRQEVQRFASLQDMEEQDCTIEEMEEYEPHLKRGCVVYAGVDYEKILKRAEQEADVVLWDGGNNDTPFYRPQVHITVCDPHRPNHEILYYPGKVNFEMADVLVINKVGSAEQEGIRIIRGNARKHNPTAVIIEARSPISVDDAQAIRGKQVLVVEDGPTLTHGEMKYGAGVLAAERYGAAELIDPRPYVVGTLAETFQAYPEIGALLPAMGYGEQQMKDLEETINRTPCEAVVLATPVNLSRILTFNKPTVRVTYELEEIGRPSLEDVLRDL